MHITLYPLGLPCLTEEFALSCIHNFPILTVSFKTQSLSHFQIRTQIILCVLTYSLYLDEDIGLL